DIEGAHNGHADSLLVFTGVTDPLQALTAPVNRRPTYLAPDLTGLLVPHPEVRVDGEGARCEGWTARWENDRIEISGDGDPYDGLRALAAAAWQEEYPCPPDAVHGALERLHLA
ncbi:MAG TPA: HAD hydrolase-like protein, partial [Spirillospora sp.]